MGSGVESEIKLKVGGPEEARARLSRIGAQLVRPRHFEDNLIFDDADSSFVASRQTLRLRRTDTGGVLTHKGPQRFEDGVKIRPERETAVADADALQAILEAMGLRPVFRYQKYREVYRWEGVEIVVDEMPIGSYLEIEGPIEAIHRAAAALGYTPSDYIRDSYVGLFFASGRTGDMVFP
jgi:adenylate cyclase class 2